MAKIKVAPYTLIDFASITEGTVFVEAGEYASLQEELPLGLDWSEVYRRIAQPTRKQSSLYGSREIPAAGYTEKVKYHDWGFYLNTLGASNCEPNMIVITGPALTDFSDIGGSLGQDQKKLLNYLEGTPFHRADRTELLAVLSRWAILNTVKHLDESKLVKKLDKTIILTNLGIIRSLQDRLSLGA